MSKSKDEQEPSMEEILSSIRRIIADEQDEDEPGEGDQLEEIDDTLDLEADDVLDLEADDADDEDVLDLTDGEDESEAFDEQPMELEAEAEEFEDDTLDLDDPVSELNEMSVDEDDDGEEMQAEPEEVFAETSAFDDESEPEIEGAFPETEDDFEEDDEDGDEADLEPIDISEPDPEPEIEPEPDFEPEPEPEPVLAQAHLNDEMEITDVGSSAKDDSLISEPAAAASTSAFAKLARAAAGDGGRAIEGGDKTVEQFLGEMIRPLLKEWLDENLNVVVERVVEQEVKKLARRAELL